MVNPITIQSHDEMLPTTKGFCLCWCLALNIYPTFRQGTQAASHLIGPSTQKCNVLLQNVNSAG